MRLNPADREQGLALLGESNGRERAKRKSGSQWVGVRADFGVVNKGRWAFCVWNESGGNLRVGWSCTESSLKLGTDKWSFGYGGTATKSSSGQFTKYGQTFGQGDAITCCVDLDRRAIIFMKNGREIPGDAFSLGKELHGYALFPHVYTKESTFSVSFDGRGGAPPLTGGYQWIASASQALVPSPFKAKPGEGLEDFEEKGLGGANQRAGFVLTPYGWRTETESGVSASTQEWRTSLDAYVKHFTALLELEYEAEKDAVAERVQKRTPHQLQADGVGVVGLGADFDKDSGRISLYSMTGNMPYLSELSRGRTVLISTVDGGVDIEDASKTISGEVESVGSTLVVSTQYERMPYIGRGRRPLFRVDLGPNIIAYKRIDRMLDELQRCLGTAQATTARNSIERLNQNQKLTGLLLPGAALANALYADIAESSASASKWDPLQRLKPNPEADISKAAREADIGASQYSAKGKLPDANDSVTLNRSQEAATRLVLERRRRFSLIQGPPGTGKTTTAVAIICGWLRTRRGPVLASAFSNRGTDNLAEVLHSLGVRVLRAGICPQEKPFSLETRLRECSAQRGEAGLRSVMQSVDVVCATCIGCGMGPLDKITFPFVVIDEAAQVIEPAVLLPLGKGAVQAVMVGDQCQLPATVLSQEAQKGGLDISMFDRLLSMGMEVQLLNEQYRMHPQIASFPSWRFYCGDLKSAVNDAARQLPKGCIFKSHTALIHVEGKEQSKGASKRNLDETACAAWLAESLLKILPSRLTGNEIGIISPYSAQVSDIRQALPKQMAPFVQVSSVDAFQGCQKDIIILSLVRANPRNDVGFVSDWRRLNVALTRARKLCVIVANLPTWLGSESNLLRDWLAFHPSENAEVKTFQRAGGGGYYRAAANSLTPLSADLDKQVTKLREEFAKNRPAAAKLPRVSVIAKGGGSDAAAAKRRTLEAGRALSEAVGKNDVDMLEAAVGKAVDAGIQNSTVEEAEDLLRKLVSLRELQVAAAGSDEPALQASIFFARSAGVTETDISQAEKAFYARLKEAKELELRTQASIQLKKAMQSNDLQALTSALDVARKRSLDSEEIKAAEAKQQKMQPKMSTPETATGVKRPASEMDSHGVVDAKVELPQGLPIPDVPGITRMQLRVVDKVGCGMVLQPTRWGMVIEDIEAKPGQPLLKIGDTLLEVDKRSLVGLDEDSCEDTFGAAFKHGAWTLALSGAQAGVDVKDLEQAEFALNKFFGRHALLHAIEAEEESELYTTLTEAKAFGVEATTLAAGEAKLRTLAAGRELRDAGVLVEALELAGVVQEEDEVTYRAAYEEALEAGVDRRLVSEAGQMLKRLKVSLEAADAMQRTEDVDPAMVHSFPPEPPSDLTATFPPLPPQLPVAVSTDDAKRRKVQFDDSEHLLPQDALKRWSLRMVEVALLQCRKRKAVEVEDFDLAHRLKQREPAANLRLAAARRAALAAPGDAQANLDGLKEEQPDPAAEEIRKRQHAQEDEELEVIKRQKREAVEQEDYGRASELRRRELELERRRRGEDANAAAAAVDMLSKEGPEAVAQRLDLGVADQIVAGASPELWEAVIADLRSAATAKH